MLKVKVNYIQIYYELHGDGFPLVMTNGLGGHVDTWNPDHIRELSKRFKLVLFDNRGAGRTDLSDKEYSIRLFADDTAGLMDALGSPRAHVFGISMGGMIAQELVINYPKKVEKLVLCSTSCGGAKAVQPSMDVVQLLMADRSGLSPEEIVRMDIPTILTEDFIKNNPEFVESHVQRTVKAPLSEEAFMRQVGALMSFDAYDRLSQIKAPTLILQGKQDILVPPENASIVAEAIPNAKLVHFENSAHILAEEMEKVPQVLTNFLAES
jgi:pimeloyl-ACP methyl ester carboxylesterase